MSKLRHWCARRCDCASSSLLAILLSLNSTDHKSPALSSTGFQKGKLWGLLLPITTPFESDGDVDTAGLRSNIAKWDRIGVNGYVVLGSTGERLHLDEREYVEVIGAARENVPAGPDGLSFIVGAGLQSTRGTIKEIKIAASAGADAVLVITPHFYRSAITQQALATHYTAVADSSPVPVILYSMPDLTGIKIQPETVAQLSEHANIVGIKDSSADVGGFKETVKLVPQDFAMLSGNGTILYDALCAGASGAILAVGCVAPRLSIEVFRAVAAGEQERAAALQEKLTPLARAVTTMYGIGGLKAALEMIGYVGGTVRAPLRLPDEAGKQEIARLLKDAEVILAQQEKSLRRAPQNSLAIPPPNF